MISLLLLAIASAAQAQEVQHIEITDVGIYKAENTGSVVPAPGTPMGKTNLVTDTGLILPLFHQMTESEQDYIIEALHAVKS